MCCICIYLFSKDFGLSCINSLNVIFMQKKQAASTLKAMRFHPKFDQNEEYDKQQKQNCIFKLFKRHTLHRYRFLWMKTETQPNKVITMAADRNKFVCLRIRGYQPHTHTHVSNVCQKCMLLVEFLSFPRTNKNDIISAAITAWNCH